MKAGTPRLLRGINDRAALDLLLEHGPLTRVRIGELTGLSKPTASQLLARLEAAGLVVTSGSTHGGPGPRAQLYAVNPDAAHVAGLDVTSARIEAAVADITGRMVGEFVLPTPRSAGLDAVAAVAHALDGACTSAGIARRRLGHVTIGTPGAFDPRVRRLRYARHLPGWHADDLLARLADEVRRPVDLHNDVNLAAIAELTSGRARGAEDAMLLWADAGLGAALIIDGRLHTGASGGAGEVGFLPLPGADVRDVRRTDSGGFQELAGGPAVLALARSHGLRAGSPHAAVAAAVRQDHRALLTELAQRFALGIAAMVTIVDPAVVVLAGRVLVAGGEPLRDLVAEELERRTLTRTAIELTTVTDRPVLRGALEVALAATRDRVFDTVAPPATPEQTRDTTTTRRRP
ncbi:MAG: ROK family transcriptional regulator [Nocardioidaceae bacterium]